MSLIHELPTFGNTFHLWKMDEKLKALVDSGCSSDPSQGEKKKKKKKKKERRKKTLKTTC